MLDELKQKFETAHKKRYEISIHSAEFTGKSLSQTTLNRFCIFEEDMSIKERIFSLYTQFSVNTLSPSNLCYDEVLILNLNLLASQAQFALPKLLYNLDLKTHESNKHSKAHRRCILKPRVCFDQKKKKQEKRRFGYIFGNLIHTLRQAEDGLNKEIVEMRSRLNQNVHKKELNRLAALHGTEKNIQRNKIREKNQKKELLDAEEKIITKEIDLINEIRREDHLRLYMLTMSRPRIFWLPNIVEKSFEAALAKRKQIYCIWKEKITKMYDADRTAYLEFCEQKHHRDATKQETHRHKT